MAQRIMAQTDCAKVNSFSIADSDVSKTEGRVASECETRFEGRALAVVQRRSDRKGTLLQTCLSAIIGALAALCLGIMIWQLFRETPQPRLNVSENTRHVGTEVVPDASKFVGRVVIDRTKPPPIVCRAGFHPRSGKNQISFSL